MNVEAERRPFFAIRDFPELCRVLAVFSYVGYYVFADYEAPFAIDLLAMIGALSLGHSVGVLLRQFWKWLRDKPVAA